MQTSDTYTLLVSLCKVISEGRKALDISDETFASEIGESVAFVKEIDQRRVNTIDVKVLRKCAAALGLSLEELFQLADQAKEMVVIELEDDCIDCSAD